jgi:hypothetical protein
MAQLEDRTVVLARIETVAGIDAIAPNLTAVPSAYATDAMLVSACDVALDITSLERANYNPSLSKDDADVGRIIARVTFTHEFRASGVFGTPPRLGRLLRACGTQETIIPNTAPAIIGDPVPGPENSPGGMAVTFTKGVTIPTNHFDTYRIIKQAPGYVVVGAGFHEIDPTVMHSEYHNAWTDSKLGTIVTDNTLLAPTFTLGGTFAPRELIEVWVGGIRFYYQVKDAGETNDEIATSIAAVIALDPRYALTVAAAGVITPDIANTAGSQLGMTLTLGQSGAEVTITDTGAVDGDYWDVPLRRPGVRYDPISDNFSSLSIYVYMDGTLHRVFASRGTYVLTANAGEYPTIAFTFTGTYNEPIDAAVPTTQVVFEKSKPWKVELAEAAVLGMPNVCAQAFTHDIANTVTAKDCINAPEAVDELRITERNPVAGLNPETTVPSIYNPWTRMRRGESTRLHFLAGKRGGVGNLARFQADSAQYTAAPLTVRNKIRAYDMAFRLSKVSDQGDDEFFFHFS